MKLWLVLTLNLDCVEVALVVHNSIQQQKKYYFLRPREDQRKWLTYVVVVFHKLRTTYIRSHARFTTHSTSLSAVTKKRNPTDHLKILEPQNSSFDVSKGHRICGSADFKALKMRIGPLWRRLLWKLFCSSSQLLPLLKRCSNVGVGRLQYDSSCAYR